MKAALTVWQGRVSPVFDVSREVLVLTIEDGAVGPRSTESIDTPTAAKKIDRLVEMGVETLICGAISEPLHHELTVRGVKVIGFVAGEIAEVVEGFLAGTLPTPLLSMPGCCGRQNRFRKGRGGGGGGRGDGAGCGRKGRP
jgi:predicted Fe-Mo cluster-binding NifX family protein